MRLYLVKTFCVALLNEIKGSGLLLTIEGVISMKKNFKKLLGAVGLTSIFVSTLVGCSNSGDEASSSNGGSTITYSIWDKGQEPGMRAIADAFEEKNPGIKVNVEVTPWDQYWTKLEAAATGGTMPDVFWMHSSQHIRYAQSGMLMDLNEVIEKSDVLDMDNFYQGVVDLYNVDGKQIAIPKDVSTIPLWYNKTLFDEAGVEYPNENWTWDDLLEAAHQLTDTEKGIYGLNAPLNTEENFFNYVYQNGGDILINDKKESGYSLEKTKETLEWYLNLSTVEKVSPSQTQFAENGNSTLFTSGKVAMGLFGSWAYNDFTANDYVAENCAVTILPEGPAGRATIYNGLGNAVAANTKNKDAAVKFIEFLGSEEANMIQAEYKSAIPAYLDAQQAWVEATTQGNFETQGLVDMLDYGYIKPYTKSTAKWEKVEMEILRKLWAEELTVDEACDQLVTEINKILAED